MPIEVKSEVSKICRLAESDDVIFSNEENENLKTRQQQEIAKWLEYAQNVKLWQDQMIEMVQRMQKEIITLKETLEEKERQLAEKKVDGARLTSWLKSGTKLSN